MSEFDDQYIDYEKEFIKIVNDEFNSKSKELSDDFNSKSKELSEETILKLKSKPIIDNLLLILCNFDEIDSKLDNITFWYTKYMIYDFIFSKDYYDLVKEKLKNYDISNVDYMKYLMLGGIFCTVVKNSYYKCTIDEFSESDNNVQKAFCNYIKDEYNKNITLLLEIYEDIKKYYPDDKETFSDVPQILSENNTFIEI